MENDMALHGCQAVHKTKSTENVDNRLQDPIQRYNTVANQHEHVDHNRAEN